MFKYILPLFLFIILAVFLAMGLTLNPREIPSPLVDKPAPEFSLPKLHHPQELLTKNDLKGKAWVLNVWASWCVSCRTEHPVLNYFAKNKTVPLIGLNYKDNPEEGKKWLKQLGNPYDMSIMDIEGRTGIDWGVYGVPETFLVDKRGMIRHKHIGPLTYNDVQQILVPMIKELQAEE